MKNNKFKNEKCFKFIKSDYENFNSEEKFDFIIFCHSFYYLKHQEALKKSFELLNSNGRIIIAIDNGEMWSVIKKFSLKENVYVYPNLIEDLKSLKLKFETKTFDWQVNLKECFNKDSKDQIPLLNWMTFTNYSKLEENLKFEILKFLKEITNDTKLYGSEHLLLIE